MKDKIFYCSLQRCGTKSFGSIFKRNGFKTASWGETNRNGWMSMLFNAPSDSIITSPAFIEYQAFEDGPWFDPNLIKEIYHTVPDSKFVYLYRPPADWFQSMLNLNKGLIIGKPKRHCYIYNRLEEYYLYTGDRSQMTMKGMSDHYINEFKNHQNKIRAFFEDKPANRFFHGNLYDQSKWNKMSDKLELGLLKTKDIHAHKSREIVADSHIAND